MDVGMMSEYELVRLENIRKNEEFLKALGLFNSSDRRRNINKGEEEITITTAARQIVRGKVKRKHRQERIERSRDDDDVPPVVRFTRSKRNVTDSALKGAVQQWTDTSTEKENDNIDTVLMRGRRRAKHGDTNADIDDDGIDDDEEVMTRFSHADLESYLLTVNSEHVDQLSDEVLRHTVYRCSYMSVAALKARLKNMTNVDKLIAFCCALRFMGLTHLYELCSNKLSSKYNVYIDLPPANSSSSPSMNQSIPSIIDEPTDTIDE